MNFDPAASALWAASRSRPGSSQEMRAGTGDFSESAERRPLADASRADAAGAAATRLLEIFADGTALVDAGGAILFANAAFERLALAAEPVVTNGARPRLGRRLAAVVARAAGEGSAAATLGGGMQPSLAAFAVALDDDRPARELALALIPLDAPPAAPTRLAQLFGLTPAEASTASLVSAGLSPRAVARLGGVSLATVKTHLHHAFAKTGTRGQPALARLLRRADGPFGR